MAALKQQNFNTSENSRNNEKAVKSKKGFYDVYGTIVINRILEGLEFVITHRISNKKRKIGGCSMSNELPFK
ncbi:hypothetical protein TcasGA2_TC009064 [Tribolium castaneum]|uniref:Uncharacterized protein n=1 Tax=Tribolium castaneum TaxID=7070 RepID=D6WPJ0_TRICA|nr:hypothetical protein TcasGA2_TC009064 [Tribolium castaneum]